MMLGLAWSFEKWLIWPTQAGGWNWVAAALFFWVGSLPTLLHACLASEGTGVCNAYPKWRGRRAWKQAKNESGTLENLHFPSSVKEVIAPQGQAAFSEWRLLFRIDITDIQRRNRFHRREDGCVMLRVRLATQLHYTSMRVWESSSISMLPCKIGLILSSYPLHRAVERIKWATSMMCAAHSKSSINVDSFPLFPFQEWWIHDPPRDTVCLSPRV